MTQPGPGGQQEPDAFDTIVQNYDTPAETDHVGGAAEAALILTELGYTERFIKRYEGKLLFVPNVGWHVYRDGRWDLDEMNEALNATRFLPAKLQEEHLAEQLIGITENELYGAIRNVSKIGTRGAILRAAEVDPRMKVSVTALNKDPWVLNVGNGTLELKTGTRRKWDPADHITQRANVDWCEDADCPRFEALLHHAFDGNEEMIRYMWRVIGYSLTGVTDAQSFFFLWGVKGSSKTTIAEVMIEMLGGYAQWLNEYALTGSEQQHPTWMVDLIGRRVVIKDELNGDRKINTGRLNSMVGGATQRARRMGRDEVDVPISCKIWITTNPRPTMGKSQDGVWRRIHPIHFKHPIAKEEMIPNYGKILAVEEGEGILRKAVEALWEALDIGEGKITNVALGAPGQVTEGVEEYQELDDDHAAFFEDIITLGDDDDWISLEDLATLHETWCEGTRTKALSKIMLGKTMAERGYKKSSPRKAMDASGKRQAVRGFTRVKVLIEGGSPLRWRPVGTVTEDVT